MTNPDLPRVRDSRDLGDAESSECAISIASDFAALVAILELQLKSLSSSSDDARTKAHLARAKTAAERGVRLSQQLMEQTQASRLSSRDS